MSVFQHPHLTRGIVKTSKGSFVVKRGLVDVPEEIGEELGWQLVDTDSEHERELSTLQSADDDEAPVRRGSRESSMLKSDREARARMMRAKAASRRARPDAQSAD